MLGDSTVSDALVVSVVWLQSMETKLYYQQGQNVQVTADTLRYRYDCAPTVAPTFHRLKAKTYGTLTNAEAGEIPLSSVEYAVGGTSAGAAVHGGWLDVQSAGTVAVTAVPTLNPDAVSSAVSLTAVAAAESPAGRRSRGPGGAARPAHTRHNTHTAHATRDRPARLSPARAPSIGSARGRGDGVRRECAGGRREGEALAQRACACCAGRG